MLGNAAARRKSVVMGLAMMMASLAVAVQPANADDASDIRASAKMEQDATCAPPPDLPRRLATQSKYDQSIGSRSVIDEAARQKRADQLAPITAALRQVASLTRHVADDQRNGARCAIQALRHWAAAKALTEMVTSDSNLTRDRFAGDIASIVLSLQARGENLGREGEIRTWLQTLARQTMAYYDFKAGPTSRRNNHRYWAGIAVADIGDILGDADMQAWSEKSFAIGACQIDENGFLPLELARAERAHEYHLYAYAALNRLAHQAARRGSADLACADRLDRLHGLVAKGEGSASSFAQRTGHVQRHPTRLQLMAASARPPASSDPSTTSDVNPL